MDNFLKLVLWGSIGYFFYKNGGIDATIVYAGALAFLMLLVLK